MIIVAKLLIAGGIGATMYVAGRFQRGQPRVSISPPPRLERVPMTELLTEGDHYLLVLDQRFRFHMLHRGLDSITATVDNFRRAEEHAFGGNVLSNVVSVEHLPTRASDYAVRVQVGGKQWNPSGLPWGLTVWDWAAGVSRSWSRQNTGWVVLNRIYRVPSGLADTSFQRKYEEGASHPIWNAIKWGGIGVAAIAAYKGIRILNPSRLRGQKELEPAGDRTTKGGRNFQVGTAFQADIHRKR